jgi:hypothetical protein
MKIWKGITAGLLILFVGYNLIYRLGGEGVGVRGNSVSFGRQHDYQLFHINAGNAVLVSNSDSDATELSVVRTVGAPFPFSVLCGGFLSDGFTVDFKEIQNKSAISQRTITKNRIQHEVSATACSLQ